MKRIVADVGPFIHLSQINQLALLKRFTAVCTPTSVIGEIKFGVDIPIKEIQRWQNVKIIHVQRKPICKIDRVIKQFRLHKVDADVIYLANQLTPCVVITDDLGLRGACERINIEVHGTVGIIAHCFKRNWISIRQAEENLTFLYYRSNLFVTYTIIENAIRQLRESV